MTRVVLASASPRRLELLRALIPTFEVDAPNIPEPFSGDPRADAVALAAAKASAVAARAPDAIVVAADTIVFDERRAYAKPESHADAVAMWQALRGREHVVVTGVAVAHGGRSVTAADEARVTLAALDDATIAAYVASGRPLDKAGAYAIQDQDVPTVTRLQGCYCCVVGLPLRTLRRLLAEVGLATPPPDTALDRCRTCPAADAAG